MILIGRGLDLEEKGEGNRERKRESAEETWERDLRPKRDELGKAKLEARAEGGAMNVEE